MSDSEVQPSPRSGSNSPPWRELWWAACAFGGLLLFMPLVLKYRILMGYEMLDPESGMAPFLWVHVPAAAAAALGALSSWQVAARGGWRWGTLGAVMLLTFCAAGVLASWSE